MRPITQAVIATGLFVGLSTGCAPHATVVNWQENGLPHHTHPTQDWWSYQFVYHPEAQVYYEPYTETWFWFDQGEWHEGAMLHPGIHIDSTRSKVVTMNTEKPHKHHETVVATHGPSWIPGHPSSLTLEHEAMMREQALAMKEAEMQAELERALMQAQLEAELELAEWEHALMQAEVGVETEQETVGEQEHAFTHVPTEND